MKYFIFLLFFGLSVTAYSANTVVEKPIEVISNLNITDNMILINKQNTFENAVAFKCYYTVEWLYKDSPFIEKLEAFA